MGLGSIAGAIGGSLISGGLSYLAQKKTNEMQADVADDQMDFQERMSNTAYQRGMADMREAGLNPILAGKLGGASSPGGAMPIFHSAGGAGISSATDVMRAAADANLKSEQTISQEVDNFMKKKVVNTVEGGDDLAKTVDRNIEKYIANESDQKKAKEAAMLWIDVGIAKAKMAGSQAYRAFKENVGNLMEKFGLGD